MHARRCRCRVGHREATRGEDNVVVLKDDNVIFTAFHIFLVVAVSVFSRSTGILEHGHCRNTKNQSVFYINYNYFTA